MSETDKLHEDEVRSDSAGQSGDLQQIPDVADADSESVEELLEEGNSFEAAAVYGVENAKDPDVSEVTTHEVPADDVPEEYLNEDKQVG
jgi:N utilization substance protein A